MARSAIPPCAAAMGCLCAGHARGDPASAECNTDERPVRATRTGARSVQLKVMLTPEERDQFEGAAWKAGEALSVYVRRAVRERMSRDVLRRQRSKTPGVE